MDQFLDDPGLREFVIEHLADGRTRNDLVTAVCERTGLRWPQAEALVEHIADEHEHVITRKQSPLLVVLALGIFLAGLFLIAAGVYPIFEVAWTAERLDDPAVIETVLHSPDLLTAIGLGLSMVFGSLIGMRNVWSAWLP